jgi:hypothetical protein
VGGFFERQDPAVAVVRDALMAEITIEAPARRTRRRTQRRLRA